jgi:hypothetical protein
MKITFENYGKVTSVDMDSDSNIYDVIDAVLTCAVGVGFSYKLTLEAMMEKYDELKGDFYEKD